MSMNETMEDIDARIEIDKGARNRKYWDLYEAAAKGDWGKAKEIYQVYPDYVRDRLSDLGDTALHVAVVAGRNDFVKNLVGSEYMQPDNLEIKNMEGNTAFLHAAMFGNIIVVLMMLEKNTDLVNIRNRNGRLPIQMAAWLGHEEMVQYLYTPTKDHFNNNDLILLLLTLIDNDIYDVALRMVKEFPGLAVYRDQKRDGNGETALHALARKPLTTLNFTKKKMLAEEKKKMHPEALELVQLLWIKIVDQLDYNQISELITTPSTLISDAAKQGNIEFIYTLISKHPALIFSVDKNNYTIFHTAVEYRHENIFNLIYGAPSIKDVVVAMKVGKDRNNILHLAARLPPDQNRLNVVSGAALQMMRELLWLKAVSNFMPRSIAGAKNGQGKTARTLFTESHKNLMKEGENWMKTTANSCMIVATLIASIVFAAAITVPGGIKDDTGAPHFLRKASFIIFAIFDIISLVSSSCSILTFLSIFTVRYAEEYFLWSLTTNLLVGLVSLFISITAMMVVFCTTLFIVFEEGTRVLAFLAVALAFIPVIIFVWQQRSLLLDLFHLNSLSNSLEKHN